MRARALLHRKVKAFVKDVMACTVNVELFGNIFYANLINSINLYLYYIFLFKNMLMIISVKNIIYY